MLEISNPTVYLEFVGYLNRISRDEVIAHILIGLPETWNTISSVVENQPPEAQTLDDVVNTLMHMRGS
jgi:hypothetical protein